MTLRFNDRPSLRRVLVDATKLAEPGVDGIKRYVFELLRAMAPLAAQRPDLEIDVSVNGVRSFPLKRLAPQLKDRSAATAFTDGWWRPGLLAKQPIRGPISLLRAADRYQRRIRRVVSKRLDRLRPPRTAYDLVHLTLPSTWRLFQRFDGERLVTVHDLSHRIVPEHQNDSNRRTLEDGLASAVGHGARFLSVSRSTAIDFSRHYGVCLGEIPVVYEACARQRFRPCDANDVQRVRRKFRIPDGPFLLTVSRVEPRKNLLGVIDACRAVRERSPNLPFRLLVAGPDGWGDGAALRQRLSECDWIRRIGPVDEADLAPLYSAASASCSLSFYEGFCLPALESLACGCPVIYSEATVMEEVVGDAGLAADPRDVASMARVVKRALTDRPAMQQLRRRAVHRAAEFSWNRAAEETLALYAAESPRPPVHAVERTPAYGQIHAVRSLAGVG